MVPCLQWNTIANIIPNSVHNTTTLNCCVVDNGRVVNLSVVTTQRKYYFSSTFIYFIPRTCNLRMRKTVATEAFRLPVEIDRLLILSVSLKRTATACTAALHTRDKTPFVRFYQQLMLVGRYSPSGSFKQSKIAHLYFTTTGM